MLREVFLLVIVVHCFGASTNAETSTEGAIVSSTTQATPEIKERFFGLDNIFGGIFKGPSYNTGLGFGGNQLTASYPNQQNPQQGNWQNIQTPQQYPNIGQDFNQQTNFNQYPSQNGYGVWNGQNQNPMIQQGNWQNGQTPQQLPNVGQDFSQQVNNYSQYPSQNGYGGDFDGQNQNPMLQQGNWQNVQTPQQAQNFNQQYPSPTQGNFNSGNSQLAGQNQNAQAQQGDWRNVRAPQKFPSQQDFSQQYNSDQYPSQSQSNFGLGANQNLNTGTIDDIKSQNEFQNQILQDNGGNTVAILGNPVPVSSTSAPDRIVFQDEWV
ncbi:uncharacterized protein [Choristoneura fumiferana]|uniref:uncharacterized protein n=1 Tax=Choristoneura fumiferana TaxID=7141 RepID=UPI003D15880E